MRLAAALWLAFCLAMALALHGRQRVVFLQPVNTLELSHAVVV